MPRMADGSENDAHSDEPTEAKPQQASPAPAKSEDGGKLLPPMMAWVQGGTPTEASEREHEERWRSAEQRRAADEAMRDLAAKPVEHGGAKLYSHKLTRRPDVPKAYIHLEVIGRGGDVLWPGGCLADVLMEDLTNPNDLTLIVVCPMCLKRGKHQDDAQIKIRQSHRAWHLATGAGEASFVFNDGYGEKVYRSAGMIMDSERMTCPQCSFRFRIDHNRMMAE